MLAETYDTLDFSSEVSSSTVGITGFLDVFAYSKEFHEGLSFDNSQGEFQEGEALYWRVNEEKDAWKEESHQEEGPIPG